MSRANLSQLEKKTLTPIGLFYNGYTFTPRTRESFHIGNAKPPSFETLAKSLFDIDGETFESSTKPVLEGLRDKGYVSTKTYLRAHNNWYPTSQAREVLNEELAGFTPWDKEFPEYYDTTDTGLVGYPGESLLHRTGVEQFHKHLSLLNRVPDSSIQLYPMGGGPQRPDIYYYDAHNGRKMMATVVIEDNEWYDDLYSYAANHDDRAAIYIGRSRAMLNRLLTYWTYSDTHQCDIPNFPLDKHKQRALTDTRDYITRTNQNNTHHAPGVSDVITITRVWDLISEDN